MLALYAHPFSSYCQKVIIALYEHGAPFDLKLLSQETPEIGAAFATLWPIRHMPLLIDDGAPVREATIIIEHLDMFHGGAQRLIPSDPRQALRTRFLDRVFDNYIMAPMQRIVFDFIRPEDARDAFGVAQARELLDRTYAWLDAELPVGDWSCGKEFSLADCAAAPALLYADWVHPITASAARLRAYRSRLLQRPSVKRAVNEARPYRGLFPPGAPDRD